MASETPVSDALRDPDAARSFYLGKVDAWGTKWGWTSAQISMAKSDVEAAYQAADDEGSGPFGYGVDLRTFYVDLARRVTDGRYKDLPSAETYARVVLSGLQAVDSAAYSTYMQSWTAFFPEVIAPTIVESAKDLREVGETAGETAAAVTKNPWLLWGGVALVALLVLRR
jgi:hypothetical protein